MGSIRLDNLKKLKGICKMIIIANALCMLFCTHMAIADDQNTLQKDTVNNAVSVLASFKSWQAEEHLITGKCLDKILNYEDQQKIQFIEKITSTQSCTLNVTFKDSSLIPLLSKQTLTYKMIVLDGDIYTWSCSFTGKNKQDLPERCQQ